MIWQRRGAVEARRAHNPDVLGSKPSGARLFFSLSFFKPVIVYEIPVGLGLLFPVTYIIFEMVLFFFFLLIIDDLYTGEGNRVEPNIL